MQSRRSGVALATALTLGFFTVQALAQNSAATNSTASRPDAWLRISAFTDVPVTGATVTVYDTSGQLLFQEYQATNDRGVYPAWVSALPPDFRVTVTSDGSQEAALDNTSARGFTLSADVRNFDPVYGVVYINPATTLVSRLADKDSQLNLRQARHEVRSFLDLPVDASIGAALREENYFHSRYFSESVFFRQAARHGGIDTFIDNLVEEMIAHPQDEHPFLGKDQVLGLHQARAAIPIPLKFIAENLASAAFHWGFGEGVGWVMQSAGLTTPDATPEAIANLQKGLADLQSSVDALSKQLQALTAQVLAKLTQTQYNQIVVPAIALAAQVNGVESNLAFYAQGCPPLPGIPTLSTQPVFADFCRDQKVTIASQLNDIQINHSFETLAAWLSDNPVVGFKGMPHLYSQALGETVRFFRPADSNKILSMFYYWDSVQTQGANLKVELLHLNGAQNNPGGIAQLKSFLGDEDANPPKNGTFQNTRELEVKAIFPPVPVGTVFDTTNRKMWATAYPNGNNPGRCSPPQPPPTKSFSKLPVLQPITWNGLSGWRSPSVPEVEALLKGRTNFTPIFWLDDQMKAVPPDFPVSPGFPNVFSLGNDCTGDNPFAWSATATGQTWNRNGNSGPIYTIIDFLVGGQIFRSTGHFTYAGGTQINWIYLLRPLAPGEQYFWYP